MPTAYASHVGLVARERELLLYASLYDCSYGANDGQFVRIQRDKKPPSPR